MSDFDPEDIINEPPLISDFDPEDIANEPAIQMEQQEEIPLTPITEQITTPMVGYGIGKAAQTGIEKTGKAILEAPEKIAMKIGGLTPEQVDYYKQNYTDIEANKGISQEAIDEAYSKLESNFKLKNIEANRARQAAESALDVPVTQKLSKQAMEAALPKVLNKVPTESEAFKGKLQENITSKVDADLNRLTNLLEQKKQMLISSSDIAQTKAEEAAKNAVEKAIPKKSVGLVKEAAPDLKAIYNEAFDKTIEQYSPEENKAKASISKDIINIQNEMQDLKNENYIQSNVEPSVREDLIKSKTTKLAKDYPSLYGYEDPSEEFMPQVRKIEGKLSDVSSLEQKDAADYLRASRELGWKKGAGGVPEVSSELSKEYAGELRSLVAPSGSKSDIEYKRVSSLLNQLEEAKQNKFITRNMGDVVDDEIIGKFDPESVSIDLNNRKTINKVLNPSQADLKDPAIKEAKIALDRLVENPDLVDEIKQAAIKANLLDEKKAFKFGPFDALRLSFATGASSFLPISVYEGMKYAKTPEGAYKLATLVPRLGDMAANYPTTSKIVSKVTKGALKALPLAGAGIGAVAAQAAEEAFSPEPSGANPEMPEYWLEKGVRNPEEQVQRARLASFKQGLPSQGAYDKMPSAYEKPEIKAYKERVLEAEKAKKLKPNYVEKLDTTDSNELQNILNTLQSGQDKVSQEYGNVLSKIIDAPESQKQATLFGLNQQPAFRELIRNIKNKG
jgi:hypothetical protein